MEGLGVVSGAVSAGSFCVELGKYTPAKRAKSPAGNLTESAKQPDICSHRKRRGGSPEGLFHQVLQPR